MKRISIIVFCLSLVLILIGCKAAESNVDSTIYDPTTDSILTTEVSLTADPAVSQGQAENTFSFMWDEWHNIESGKLMFTVSNPRVTKKCPETGEFYGADLWFLDETECDYPTCVNADGTFIDGVYMILLDVTVTSDNAVCYTSDYYDPETGYSGQFDDPYLFSAQSIGYFCDIEKKDSAITNYFSEAKVYEDSGNPNSNPFLFRILPGETLNFVIGCVLTEKSSGGLWDITNIHFTGTTDLSGGFDFDLNLSLPEN